MSEADEWFSILQVVQAVRPKLVEYAQKKLIETRAQKYVEDKYSDEARALIAAARIQQYRMSGSLAPGPSDAEIEAYVASLPTTRFVSDRHPIPYELWTWIGEDASIWQDASWSHATEDGKFGTHLFGIEFSFGEFSILRKEWLGQDFTTAAEGRRSRPQVDFAELKAFLQAQHQLGNWSDWSRQAYQLAKNHFSEFYVKKATVGDAARDLGLTGAR